MVDRQAEFYLMGAIANVMRHTHPGLAPLEQPQFPEFGQAQRAKVLETAAWFDQPCSSLGSQASVSRWRTSPRFAPSNLAA
jgi:hypothetical protein